MENYLVNTFSSLEVRDLLVEIWLVDLLKKVLMYIMLNAIIREVKPSIYFICHISGDSSQKKHQRIMASNLICTINVESSKKIGFDLLVNTSSSSEYSIKSGPMEETNLLELVNDYGVYKAVQHPIILYYNK